MKQLGQFLLILLLVAPLPVQARHNRACPRLPRDSASSCWLTIRIPTTENTKTA
jgi:hypothetical protein